MCGISGIVNFNHKPAEESQLHEMNRIIHHRGPDGEGIFVDGNVGIGSTRLSIIDLRHIADMPMTDSDERYVIVFNGEIFNYIEVRDELLKKGYRFKNDSDTEVILNAYKEWGEDCLHRLNGMWAFLIWDKKEKKLFGSRDRYGIKPFYYYKDNERLIVGSEIKQILSCGVERKAEDEIVYDFLTFNFTDHTEKTFFKNIFKLPAGWKITVQGNDVKISKWYELLINENSANRKTLYEDFYNLFYDSVRLRLRSDVEVGSCLSGGLDSSSIVCAMHEFLKKEDRTKIQKTFTAAYNEIELDEKSFVDEVLKQTNSASYFLYPDSKGFAEDFDKIAYHQEEPFVGATVFAQWSVFKKIHEANLKVVLDGQGADEILIGYFSFFPFHLKRNLLNPVKYVSEFIHGVNTTQLGLFKFTQNFVYFSSTGIRYRHVLKNAKSFMNPSFVNSFCRRNLFDDMVAVDNLQTNRLSNLWRISLPSLLRYEDKNSMAFSVEARLPFLDHRLVEFIFSIPFDELIKKGWTKNVLRQSMKNKIPEKVRMRKGKLAFSVPQKKWLDEIKSIFTDLFNKSQRSSKFVDGKKILSMIDSGKYNDNLLFRAVSLEKWMRVFNISS